MPNHKFVKTTPKPSATKNSNGELVGPLPVLLLFPESVGLAEGTLAVPEEDIVVRGVANGPYV